MCGKFLLVTAPESRQQTKSGPFHAAALGISQIDPNGVVGITTRTIITISR